MNVVSPSPGRLLWKQLLAASSGYRRARPSSRTPDGSDSAVAAGEPSVSPQTDVTHTHSGSDCWQRCTWMQFK